jgi:hypothetical protein
LSALIPIAVETTLIAFRVGSKVGSVARNLYVGSATEGESWTYIIPSISESAAQTAINDFHTANVS